MVTWLVILSIVVLLVVAAMVGMLFRMNELDQRAAGSDASGRALFPAAADAGQDMTSYAVLALITLNDVTKDEAEDLTKRIYGSLWDAMPERPQPDAMVILFDGTPVHKIFGTKANPQPSSRIRDAMGLMR